LKFCSCQPSKIAQKSQLVQSVYGGIVILGIEVTKRRKNVRKTIQLQKGFAPYFYAKFQRRIFLQQMPKNMHLV